MPTFYAAIDLTKNELRNAIVQNLGSAPSSPSKGQLYYDSTGNVLYWYNGSQWIAAQGGAGLTPATTVTTEAVGDAAVVGVSTNYAREDHKHGREAFGAVTAQTSFGAASGNGSAATVTRSDHTHGTPLHDNAAHSAVALSALAVPTTSVNFNNQKLINVADPTAATDGANKQYVDNLSAGLSWKDAVRVASTANLTLNGTQTVDGVTVNNGDRVLVKNQTTGGTDVYNGIYVAVTPSGPWNRATDADTAAEIEGMAVFVMEGTTQADTAWVCTANAPITITTTALPFVQFSGASAATAGAGLTATGNVFNVGAGTGIAVAADSIALDTTYADGRYALATRTLTTTAPLTGGGDLSANRTLGITNFTSGAAGTVPASGGGTTTFMRADGTWAAPAGGGTVNKFAAALTGTASPETVTHNLNTRDIHLAVYNGATPYTAVEVDWDATTVNTAVVRYNPNLGAGYRVVVMG